MKFLVDNQLPPALSRYLAGQGHDSYHITEIDLDQASDVEIWAQARSRGLAIVSKDEDFLHLATSDPQGPPFAWVRLGNCRTPVLLAAFDRRLPQVIRALEEGQKVIEIR